MAEQKNEFIEFDGLKVPIYRHGANETFIALQPPDATPYIMTPVEKKPEEIVSFVTERIETIRELRTDMIKRFEKSPSLKCRYQTGDIVYLLGRPFMLRVFPFPDSKKMKQSVRGRAKVKATIRNDVSIIDLFLVKVGDYDQGRLAFLSFATSIFENNAKRIVEQATANVFPQVPVYKKVRLRPMRHDRVQIDTKQKIVWFSESLIPYPGDCMVLSYLEKLIDLYAPEADESEREALLEAGLPNWRQMRTLLQDKESPFTRQ